MTQTIALTWNQGTMNYGFLFVLFCLYFVCLFVCLLLFFLFCFACNFVCLFVVFYIFYFILFVRMPIEMFKNYWFIKVWYRSSKYLNKACIIPHHHRTNSSWLRWLPQMSWNQLVNIDESYVIWYDLIFFPTYVSSLTIL